ncbi:MAG: hypothetical protein ACRDVG_06510 [Jatrophihabitantaceae bacterium]
MVARVYLHVGEPKCGTTFLQHVLWGNRSPLARQGVLLPGASEHDQFRATQDLRDAVQPADDPAGSWSGEWDILARQALGADRVAIISHEMLAGATPEQADRAVRSLTPAEVHIVVTVRDIASLLPAEWQETIKHQNSQAWGSWLNAVISRTDARRIGWFWTVHDTVDLLRRWGARVHPSHIHVITMPRAGAPPTLLWERFASVIGVDAATVDTSVARPNSSLGIAETEMLRHLNARLRGDRQLPQWFYSGHVKETLAHEILAERPRSPRLVLPAVRDEWAAEIAEKQIAGLSDAGYEFVGDVDELRPQPIEGRRPKPKDATYKQLYEASLDALAGLLWERYETVTSRASLKSLISGRATQLPGAYRVRRIARDLTASHPALARLRVLVWRLTERTRRWRKGT